jgi:hypothetical protein
MDFSEQSFSKINGTCFENRMQGALQLNYKSILKNKTE